MWESMSNLIPSETQLDLGGARQQNMPAYRIRTLRVLFIHRDASAVDVCVQELKKCQFSVTFDIVLNFAQCKEQLRSQAYDVLVVEYPSPSCNGAQALQFIPQTVQDIPLIFLTTDSACEFVAEFSAHGTFEFVEREHIARLPMAVRRVLNEQKLREELEDARKALHHSQSLYRALIDNPTYGIFRCDAEERLLDVNQALATMLGYESKEQLLAAHQESAIIPSFGNGSPFSEKSCDTQPIEPVEIEWKRKDGTLLKARLSGRGVLDAAGNYAGHEIIAMDVTEQRTLEDQLRHQASCDSLTGLANHGRLFEVLHAEICRTKRTSREFCVVLLDLDGLKQINDQYSHLTGDRALCRFAQVLKDCSRSIDTAARHGGDEFALVLPETGVAAASLVARRICDLLANDTEEPALSASFGIASYPREANTIGNLLYAADRALYEMKARRPVAARAAHASASTSLDTNLESCRNR
jgi:two-component system, cell cycle response regulator